MLVQCRSFSKSRCSIKKLYGKISIPEAVKYEVFKSKALPDWIEVTETTQSNAHGVLEKNLGRGEGEAILLSIEQNAELLILDDLAARKMAQKMGVKTTGVSGILLEAKK